MNYIKSKLSALLLAFALASSANAAIVSTTPNMITGTGTFSNNVSGPSFDDYVQFSVGANSGSTWSAMSTNFLTLVGLSSLSSSLFSGTWDAGTIGGAGPAVAVGTPAFGVLPGMIIPGFTLTATSGQTGMLAGNYTLHLSGSVYSGGGSYAGTITLAPIPEPGEWALMLSGFGLIALMIRRRSANAS